MEPQFTDLQAKLLNGTDYVNPSFDKLKRYISGYITTVDTDYISVDIYPMAENEDGTVKSTDSRWLHYLDMYGEVARDTNRDLWVITQVGGFKPGNHETNNSLRYTEEKSDFTQQAYASMAFGARTLIWACVQGGWNEGDSHIFNNAGQPTPAYDALKAANADLKAFSDVYMQYDYLGTFMKNAPKVAGQSYDVFHNGLKLWDRPLITSKNGLLVGSFEAKEGKGKGKAYIITNMEELQDNTTAELKFFKPLGAKELVVYQNGKSTVSTGLSVKITLAPGDGVFVVAK